MIWVWFPSSQVSATCTSYPFPGIVVILPGAPVTWPAYLALLLEKPLQEPVLLHPLGRRAPEPFHQSAEVPGTDRKAAAPHSGAGILVARGLFFLLFEVAPRDPLRDQPAQLGV